MYYGYPCCGSVSANVYGHWGNAAYSNHALVVCDLGGTVGTTASGAYTSERTGTTGSYQAGRSYNPYTGQARQAMTVRSTRPVAPLATWPVGKLQHLYGAAPYGSNISHWSWR